MFKEISRSLCKQTKKKTPPGILCHVQNGTIFFGDVIISSLYNLSKKPRLLRSKYEGKFESLLRHFFKKIARLSKKESLHFDDSYYFVVKMNHFDLQIDFFFNILSYLHLKLREHHHIKIVYLNRNRNCRFLDLVFAE